MRYSIFLVGPFFYTRTHFFSLCIKSKFPPCVLQPKQTIWNHSLKCSAIYKDIGYVRIAIVIRERPPYFGNTSNDITITVLILYCWYIGLFHLNLAPKIIPLKFAQSVRVVNFSLWSYKLCHHPLIIHSLRFVIGRQIHSWIFTVSNSFGVECVCLPWHAEPGLMNEINVRWS